MKGWEHVSRHSSGLPVCCNCAVAAHKSTLSVCGIYWSRFHGWLRHSELFLEGLFSLSKFSKPVSVGFVFLRMFFFSIFGVYYTKGPLCGWTEGKHKLPNHLQPGPSRCCGIVDFTAQSKQWRSRSTPTVTVESTSSLDTHRWHSHTPSLLCLRLFLCLSRKEASAPLIPAVILEV